MNELLRISDANNGLDRRVMVLRYPPPPEGEQDPRVKELVKTEGCYSCTNARSTRYNCGQHFHSVKPVALPNHPTCL